MVVLTVLVLSYHTFPSSSHSLASVFLTIDSLRVTSPGGYSSTRIREAGQVGQARTMMEDWGQISEFLYLYPTLSHYIILCLHINCHYCKYVERERHTHIIYIYYHIFICVSVFELTSLRSLFRYNVYIYIHMYMSYCRCSIQGVAAGLLMATQSPATWFPHPGHVLCSSSLFVLHRGCFA
jgi:hypothetical protein